MLTTSRFSPIHRLVGIYFRLKCLCVEKPYGCLRSTRFFSSNLLFCGIDKLIFFFEFCNWELAFFFSANFLLISFSNLLRFHKLQKYFFISICAMKNFRGNTHLPGKGPVELFITNKRMGRAIKKNIRLIFFFFFTFVQRIF